MIIDKNKVGKEYPVIAWWSGGVTSAVACKLAIEIYGAENVRVIFIDTLNEDEDTYRFSLDCERWYGVYIESITNIGIQYANIQEIWYKYRSLNISNGASCSLRIKRYSREQWEKHSKWSYQVFGFDINEGRRALSMKNNAPHTNPIFPLLLHGYNKKECIEIIEAAGIAVPRSYHYGFLNNNCLKTGCVQGGIGYWQKMKRDFSDKFEAMAKVEHDLTNLKGEPVTMLKDQSKGGGLVFLKPHPAYPYVKDISMMKGREPKPLMECNGFCGINDFSERNPTEQEINYAEVADQFNREQADETSVATDAK